MTQVTIQIYPKELETLKAELEDLGTPTITFHSVVTLETKPVQEKVVIQSRPAYVLMRCNYYNAADNEVLAGKGQIVDFVGGTAEADIVLNNLYDFWSRSSWFLDPVSGREMLSTMLKGDTSHIIFYLYGID